MGGRPPMSRLPVRGRQSLGRLMSDVRSSPARARAAAGNYRHTPAHAALANVWCCASLIVASAKARGAPASSLAAADMHGRIHTTGSEDRQIGEGGRTIISINSMPRILGGLIMKLSDNKVLL